MSWSRGGGFRAIGKKIFHVAAHNVFEANSSGNYRSQYGIMLDFIPPRFHNNLLVLW